MQAKPEDSVKPPGASPWLATILTASCALLLAPAGCGFRKPAVRLADIRVAGLGFQKLDLIFDLKITNPNPYQIGISSFAYSLMAGGERFAEGALPPPIAPLGASQTTHIHAPVALLYSSLLPVVEKLPSAEAIPYEFAGTVTFNFLGTMVRVPLAHTGYIPPLRAPSWRFRDAQLIKGAAPVVKLTFEVDNPNAFELPLEQLRGSLQVGDKPLIQVNEVSLAPVPPGKTGTLTVPVGIKVADAMTALTAALRQPRALRFEGELRFGSPASLRRMLLGSAHGRE